MLSSLHCICQEDDLYQQWPVCGFSIALSRYLQTWWRKKQQISLFAQVDRGIFFSQVDRWIFLVSLIRQDALAKSLIINALAAGTTWHVRGNWALKMLQNNDVLLQIHCFKTQSKFWKDGQLTGILAVWSNNPLSKKLTKCISFSLPICWSWKTRRV